MIIVRLLANYIPDTWNLSTTLCLVIIETFFEAVILGLIVSAIT